MRLVVRWLQLGHFVAFLSYFVQIHGKFIAKSIACDFAPLCKLRLYFFQIIFVECQSLLMMAEFVCTVMTVALAKHRAWKLLAQH